MHIGHYISGFVHAGILSWVLFGAWFAPPSSTPIEAVNVAIVSRSEYSAMLMSDVPPKVTLEAKKIEQSQETLENIPFFPKEEFIISKISDMDQVADAGEPESKPNMPEPITVIRPELTKDLPILTTPSENVFALLKSPKTFESPHKAERIAPSAIAPVPSELTTDEQTQDIVIPQNIDELSKE